MNTDGQLIDDRTGVGVSASPLAARAESPPSTREGSGGWKWRYAVYAIFIIIRLAQHARDQNFPTHDGMQYYSKAVWMATEPLSRAFTGEAFSHQQIRPPGVMWLLLPFLILSKSLAAYVVGMSFWLAAFVELAVRRCCGREGALRNWAAVALLCATGNFFGPRDAFLVDGLMAAEMAAIMGLAVAWLREKRQGDALGLGVMLCLAVLTKPAAVYAMAATGGGLAAALLVLWRLEKTSWREGLALPARTLLLWAGVPAAAGLAGLFFTPYSKTLTFRDVMKVPGFGNFGLGETYSADSFLRVFLYVYGNLGTFLTVTALGTAVVLTWCVATGAAPARRAAGVVFSLVAVCLFMVAIAGTPVIQPRYLAPAALGVVLWAVCAAAAVGTRGAVAAVGLCALSGVAWQTLSLNGKLPRKPWVISTTAVRDSQSGAKDAFAAFTTSIVRHPSAMPLLFSTDMLSDCTAFFGSTHLSGLGLEHALEALRSPKPFTVKGVSFPHANLFPSFSTDFLFADYLLVSKPNLVWEMPPGSGSAVWQRINNRLWDKSVAERLGWQELLRTRTGVLYVGSDAASAGEGGAPAPAVRRAAWLLGEDLTAPDEQKLRTALEPWAAVAGFSPADRNVVTNPASKGAGSGMEFLLHPEWKKNTYPTSIHLATSSGTMLRTRMTGKGSDGVSLVVTAEDESASAPLVLLERHVTKESPATVELRELTASLPSADGNTSLTVTVYPGPKGNAAFDAIWIQLLPSAQR